VIEQLQFAPDSDPDLTGFWLDRLGLRGLEQRRPAALSLGAGATPGSCCSTSLFRRSKRRCAQTCARRCWRNRASSALECRC
jgi:hypothetical protein